MRTRCGPLTERQDYQRSQHLKRLQYRNFALLWFGLILSNIGTWIQVIAQSLLVLALMHNSDVALGVISFAQAFPFFIFALVGGGIADKTDKRKLLPFTQTVQMVLAFTLRILTLTGFIQFWHVSSNSGTSL